MSAGRRWAAAPGGICVRRAPRARVHPRDERPVSASWDVVAARLCEAVRSAAPAASKLPAQLTPGRGGASDRT
jgi:hypothetical protein